MASKHRLDFVDSEMDGIRGGNLLRELRYGRIRGAHISIGGKRLVNLCSNDYLGIRPTRIRSSRMQSSSRLVSGNDESHRRLEDFLAGHKSQQASLVYPTGYMANLGVIPTVAKKGDLVVSDELNHASIIEACRLSGATVAVCRHNDADDMRKKLKQKGKNKFVVTEGIFSMDGDYSPLRQIAEIAEKAGAVTIVDDAHGDFAVGRDGRGTPERLGVAGRVDVYVSSLSKGLGSFGGYVASQKNVVDLCTNRSKPFIYTSALPAPLINHAMDRIRSDRKGRKKRLEENARRLSRGLKQMGYGTDSQTHIIPVLVGMEKTAVEFGRFLFENGVFVQPIRHPTVPRNRARLRLSATAWLSDADIEESLGVFDRAFAKFGRTIA